MDDKAVREFLVVRKLILLLKLSRVMTIEPEKRESQLSPVKHGLIKGRTAYFIMAILNIRGILALSDENLDQLEYLYHNHPESVPSVFWPYQSASWGLHNRLKSLYNHFQSPLVVNGIFKCERYEKKQLICLNDLYRDMSLVLDHNGIFLREGMSVLNICVKNERVFSLAFSLFTTESGLLSAYIGAIQGRRMDNIALLYHDITKATHGIRPRDLMVELFQMVCQAIGIDKIFAVRDAMRQQRHTFYYFKNKCELLKMDYDEVWKERGGECCENDFFILPVKPDKRPLNTIRAKKRSMYRKRYEMLDRLENHIKLNLKTSAMSTY
jgi:uncharacterized protein VirK/YbjX